MRVRILRDKINLRKVDLGILNPITHEEWVSIVESIDELIWMDDTEIGKKFYKDKSDRHRRKSTCFYKYNPEADYVAITITWVDFGFISADSSIRKTDFIFDLADKFKARVFNIQKEVFRK